MKNLITLFFLCFFLCFKISVYAQDPIYNPNNATTNKSTDGPAISFQDKMDMFYTGIDNPVTISVSGYTPDEIVVTISGGGNFRSNNSMGPYHYIFKPDGSEREVTVKISAKMKDGTTKLLNERQFRIRKIPHPEVLFGTRNGGSITPEEVSAVSQINAGLGEGFAFEGLKYQVNSYTFAIAPVKGDRYFEEITGNRLTAAAKEALKNVKAGDLIIVTGIEATGPTGKVRLSGVSLIVK